MQVATPDGDPAESGAIKRVVVWLGVGYSNIRKVDGDASVDLKFSVDNINDLKAWSSNRGGQISCYLRVASDHQNAADFFQ